MPTGTKKEARTFLIPFMIAAILSVTFMTGFMVVVSQKVECNKIKEAYKKEASKQHVCAYTNRHTLHEKTNASFVQDDPEYTVAIDFLWTKKGDVFNYRRVIHVLLDVPVKDKLSDVGQAIINLDIKRLPKCKSRFARENHYCLTVETSTYQDEKQLTPYVLASWIPDKYKHNYGCVTIDKKNGKVGLKRVDCP